MSSNLTDLNNHLFAQLDRLGNKDLDAEELECEVKRTNAVVSISEQVINNARIALDAAELVAKHGVGKWENMLPPVEGRPEAPGLPDYSKGKVVK